MKNQIRKDTSTVKKDINTLTEDVGYGLNQQDAKAQYIAKKVPRYPWASGGRLVPTTPLSKFLLTLVAKRTATQAPVEPSRTTGTENANPTPTS